MAKYCDCEPHKTTGYPDYDTIFTCSECLLLVEEYFVSNLLWPLEDSEEKFELDTPIEMFYIFRSYNLE